MGRRPANCSRDDLRGEVRVVVGLHSHRRAGQAGTDEFGDVFRAHGIRVHGVILSVMIARMNAQLKARSGRD